MAIPSIACGPVNLVNPAEQFTVAGEGSDQLAVAQTLQHVPEAFGALLEKWVWGTSCPTGTSR